MWGRKKRWRTKPNSPTRNQNLCERKNENEQWRRQDRLRHRSLRLHSFMDRQPPPPPWLHCQGLCSRPKFVYISIFITFLPLNSRYFFNISKSVCFFFSCSVLLLPGLYGSFNILSVSTFMCMLCWYTCDILCSVTFGFCDCLNWKFFWFVLLFSWHFWKYETYLFAILRFLALGKDVWFLWK